MKKIKCKKIKIIISIILILVSLFTIKNCEYITQRYSRKLVNIVSLNKERDLTDEQLKDYDVKINKELKNNKSNKSIKISYYSLGTIKYLENDYHKSIEYLLESLKYKSSNSDKIDLMIFSALSSSYMQLKNLEESDKYFKQGESLALSKDMKEKLCELYYARAKAMLLSGYNLDEVLSLAQESLKYTKTNEHKVRNYLFIASISRLKGDSITSLKYTIEALRISLKIKNSELINQSVINLGENYYIQKNYTKTIDIYEKLIESNRLTNNQNKLMVYGYLLESYFKIGDYKKFKNYEKKYLDTTKYIDEKSKNKELTWLYAICSSAEIEFSNISLAKDSLIKAEKLYSENKTNVYANMDLYILNSKIKIEYYENKDYIEILDSYADLMDKIEERGIVSDIKQDVIDEVLKISYINKDYKTMIKYIEKDEKYLKKEISQVHTDNVFNEINEITNEMEINHFRFKASILVIIMIAMIYEMANINKKNKKIKFAVRRI